MRALLGYRSVVLRGLAIFFILAWAFHASAAPAFKAQILTFNGSSLWEATHSELIQEGDRFREIRTQSDFDAGNCGDMLANFQRAPLEVMLKDGYIDRPTFEKLMNFQALGVSPGQLTLITLFSDLNVHEVQNIFGAGGVPKNRQMSGGDKNLQRVRRGTLYLVRGFEINTDMDSAQSVLPGVLPWEADAELPEGLTRTIDRTRLPYPVEVGRVQMEDKALPGNMQIAVKLATAVLDSQMHTLKVDPRRVMIVGHFLEADRTRLFTRFFPLKPLSDERLAQIEARGLVDDEDMNVPLPKGRAEWDKVGHALTFGSLQGFVREFPIEETSQAAHLIQQRIGGKITGTEAFAITRDYALTAREIFEFHLDGIGRTRYPLMWTSFDTPIFKERMGRVFRAHGHDYDSQVTSETFRQLDGRNAWPEAFTSNWVEKIFYVPSDAQKNEVPGHYLSNLDPEIIGRGGSLYAAAILLSLIDHVEKKLEAYSPQRFKTALRDLNEQRLKVSLAPVSTIDVQNYFETYPIFVGSQDPKVVAALKEIGAKAVSSLALRASFPSGPIDTLEKFNLALEVSPIEQYKFDGKKVMQLRENYRGLNMEARRRLNPGRHLEAIGLLLGGAL